ncbi:MAG: PadR family transcriptional regulator [Solirubrobacterales bacterium]
MPDESAKREKSIPKDAVAKAAGAATEQYLREQREAVADPSAAPAAKKRGSKDPLAGELRKQLLPLLVLHFARDEPTYGNQLIDRITKLTGGVLTVNPNTMYPLLRDFEARGLIEGQWEHPERRSRRFYTLTKAGDEELARLLPGAREALSTLTTTLADIEAELDG